jgi:UDP-N-acetylglucosamine--N-acetylmuramyl-(pentapeptide) pyrophosphoryl-undecaprenol N-acetylglucosamine transferase
MSQRRALFVAGGTGGHLYPAVAVARELVKASSGEPFEVRFAVRRGDLGHEILEKEGFQVIPLEGQGMPRTMSFAWLSFASKVLRGFWQADRAIQSFAPHVVVGMGGYLSFPVLVAAKRRGLPALIHEQNVVPGVANRLLSRWVDSVAVSFEASVKRFPAGKTWISGLPVREEIGRVEPRDGRARLGLAPDRFTFLVFGGSLGAQRLNQSLLEVWPEMPAADRWQVVHITGAKDFERVRKRYSNLGVTACVLPYCHRMADAYAAADFVICRAGASTIAELLVSGRRALLVPFPFASADHQLYNAQVLKERGQAEILQERQWTTESVRRILANALSAPAPKAASPPANDAAVRLSAAIRRGVAGSFKQL